MAYKVVLNPFDGSLQLVTATTGTSGVFGIPPTTVGAIAVWDDTLATTIMNSLTNVQASGAIEAQAFITRRDVVGTVTVNSDETWVSAAIELSLTGSIIISDNAQIIVV
jgi:hypothetical protein